MIKIREFFKTYNEYSTLLVGLVILCLLPFGLRLIDPTAASIDIGSVSVIALAAFAVLVFQALTWLCTKMVWKIIGDYFEVYFERTFKCLTNLQKVCIGLFIYFSLFWAFIVALASLS